VATRRRIVFTLCFMGLTAVALALPASAPGLSRGEERAREQQIKDLEKQVLDLNGKLSELKNETPKAALALPEQPQTKVAVVNLSYVMKSYKKWTALQKDHKKMVEDLEVELKSMQDTFEAKQKLIQTIEDDATRKMLRKELDDLLKRTNKKGDEAKKTFADLEAKSIAVIYKDIQAVSERCAKSHGIDLVMHFNDGTTEDEVNTPINIRRKMYQGALFPLYITPGMDMSKEVLALLNEEKAPALEKDE
jgi:Skp family chaperone for outer membrane proteins